MTRHNNYLIEHESRYAWNGTGNKMLREFVSDSDEIYDGVPGGMYYSQFGRLAVYMENKYGITSIKSLRTSHVYELLEYMRTEGFKDATLKYHITSIRQVYKDHQELFSEEFVLPTNAAYEQYRQENKA